MIYIVIFVYNEEKGIEKVISGLNENLRNRKDGYEIIIINDGSTDGTVDALSRLKGINKLKVINHVKNKGIRASFYSAFREIYRLASDTDIVIIMEGDNTCDVSLLPKMIEGIEAGSGIIIASRLCPGGEYIAYPFFKKMVSFIGNKVMKFIFPLSGVTDYTMFYRAYSARIIKQAFRRYSDALLELGGFVCGVELLLKLRRFTDDISEIPTVSRYDRKESVSKMNMFLTTFQYIKLICQRERYWDYKE